MVIKVTAIKRNVAIVVHGGWWMVYGCQQSAMSHRPSTIDSTLKLRLFAVGLIMIKPLLLKQAKKGIVQVAVNKKG